MKKKLVATALSLLLATGLSLPCYATNAGTDAMMSVPVEELLGQRNEPQNLSDLHANQFAQKVEQFSNIENLDLSTLESTPTATASAFTTVSGNVSRNANDSSEMSTSDSIDTEAKLIEALRDPSNNTICITQNISLTNPLVINRSVTITATSDLKIYAPAGMRHMIINNQSNITLGFSNVILDGNDLGGGIEINTSDVSISGAVIQKCSDNGDFDGGAIYATNVVFNSVDGVATATPSGSLTLSACEFDGNDTEGASIVSLGQFTASKISVLNNEDGSGITVMNLTDTSMTANLVDVIVQGNSSESFGGGINLARVTATITGTMKSDETTGETTSTSVISGNSSNYGGGGIYSYLSDTSVDGVIIDNNTCNYSGNYGNYEGIELGGAGIMSIGTLTLTDSFINNNHANCIDASGAGVYAASSAAYSENLGDIDDSMIYISNVTVSGCQINNNEGFYTVNGEEQDHFLYGGGMFLYGVYLDISDTQIEDNDATMGGGMYVLYEFGEDTPAINWNNPDVTLSGVHIQNNSSVGMGGGAVFVGGYDDDKDDDSIDKMNSLLIIDESIIHQNDSCYGGGIATVGFSTIVDGDSVFSWNEANGNPELTADDNDGFVPSWSGAGGGILLYGSNILLKSAALLNNGANAAESEEEVLESAGGGAYAKFHSTITVNSSTFLAEGNYADNGGAFYIEEEAEISLPSGTIYDNSATNGGGICAAGSVTINGGSVSNNRAGEDGGGIYSTGTINFQSGTILSNSADNNGGGIFSTANLNIHSGTISNNTTKRNGGGVYGKNVNFTVGGAALVENNRALGTASGASSTKGRGGGLYVSGGVLALLSADTTHIRNNYAKYGGGGVYLVNSTYFLYPTTVEAIHDNTKGNDVPSNLEQ